jgi:glycerophosphoryl diester phosphodiesterase
MKVFAHRGFSHKYPEMTRIAYQAAIEAGVDGFECDVRLTKDKEIMCFHDSDTKRITGKRKLVSRVSAQELIRDANVMRLEELLVMAIEAKKDLLIESKHPVLSSGEIEYRTMDLINKYGQEIDRAGIDVVIISFSFWAVRRVGKRDAKCAKVIRYGISALFARYEYVAIKITTLKRYPFLINLMRAKRIYVWTVNLKEDLKWLKSREIYGVITDRPKRALKILKN